MTDGRTNEPDRVQSDGIGPISGKQRFEADPSKVQLGFLRRIIQITWGYCRASPSGSDLSPQQIEHIVAQAQRESVALGEVACTTTPIVVGTMNELRIDGEEFLGGVDLARINGRVFVPEVPSILVEGPFTAGRCSVNSENELDGAAVFSADGQPFCVIDSSTVVGGDPMPRAELIRDLFNAQANHNFGDARIEDPTDDAFFQLGREVAKLDANQCSREQFADNVEGIIRELIGDDSDELVLPAGSAEAEGDFAPISADHTAILRKVLQNERVVEMVAQELAALEDRIWQDLLAAVRERYREEARKLAE